LSKSACADRSSHCKGCSQLGGLEGDALGDLGEVGPAAADDGASAGAARRTVVVAEAAGVAALALELVARHLGERHVAEVRRRRALRRHAPHACAPQPLAQPPQVAVAVERVSAQLPEKSQISARFVPFWFQLKKFRTKVEDNLTLNLLCLNEFSVEQHLTGFEGR